VVGDIRHDRVDPLERGDLITASRPRDQGKSRQALIIQSDHLAEFAALTVLPITSTLTDAPLLRIQVDPTPQNGLLKRSEIMIDKPQTPPRTRLGPVIGRLDDTIMLAVSRSLAVSLGLA
jgi:mRNA interferase MazF